MHGKGHANLNRNSHNNVFSEQLIKQGQTLYRLGLSDITSKFRTVAIFVILKLQATFHAVCTGKYRQKLSLAFAFNPKGYFILKSTKITQTKVP